MFEKEKVLVICIFFCFQQCFHPFQQQISKCLTGNDKRFNPVTYMPILGSFNSSASKDMMSKIGTNGDTIPDLVENIVGKEEIAHLEQFLLFPQCFHRLSAVDASK